jgi:hypothetical protein
MFLLIAYNNNKNMEYWQDLRADNQLFLVFVSNFIDFCRQLPVDIGNNIARIVCA